MEEMNAAVMAGTSKAVQLWMNWMSIIYLAAIFFVWKHKSARYILASLLLMVPIALLIFKQTNNIHLLGIAHILVWCPLTFYLLKVEVIGKTEKLKSPYGVYLILLLTTFAISIVFDVRDVILVFMGIK